MKKILIAIIKKTYHTCKIFNKKEPQLRIVFVVDKNAQWNNTNHVRVVSRHKTISLKKFSQRKTRKYLARFLRICAEVSRK